MYAAEVERYLEALNEELVIQGIVTPVPVLLLGGVFITMEVDSRRATDDVDVLPFIGAEKDTATNLPLAVALHMAAEAVARRYRLHPAWLNTVRPGALQPPGIVPERHLWKLYQVLHVYLPNPEFVLVQKLLIHRPKDQPDIQALFSKLKVSSRAEAQALVDRYVPVDEQQRHNLALVLRTYFPA